MSKNRNTKDILTNKNDSTNANNKDNQEIY